MARKLLFPLVLLVVAALGPRTAAAEVEVVTTVPDLAALAREVGGSRIEARALALPTQDPHFVDAKPSLALELNRADLLVAIGLQLESGWLPTLQTGARNPKIQRGGRGYLECSRHVGLKDVPKGRVDRSQGDIHPGGNPHFLFDPRRAKLCAAAIADKLIEIDPEGAEHYKRRYQAFSEAVDRKAAEWRERMKEFRGHSVLTYHRSWIYFTDWLGLEVAERLEPKPGISPTPSHVVRVIKTGKRKEVKAILQESFYPSRTGKLVAKKIGAELVKLPAGADVGSGETYLEHMEKMVSALEEALGG